MVAITPLLLTLFFIASASALPTPTPASAAVLKKKSPFNTLKDDIAKIHEKAGKVIKDMPGCGDSWCAAKLMGQADEVMEMVEDAGKDLTTSLPSTKKKFGKHDAKKIVALLDTSLEKDVTGMLHGMEKHEELKSLRARVRPYLRELKITIKAFGAVLEGKVPQKFEGKVRKGVDEMVAEVEMAVGVFGGEERGGEGEERMRLSFVREIPRKM